MLEKVRSVQFVMIVSFVSSLLLAFVAMSLKPSIDKNIILDKKQSILKSIDIDVSKLSNIERIFLAIFLNVCLSMHF